MTAPAAAATVVSRGRRVAQDGGTPPSPVATVRVALAGCGAVGGALADLLPQANAEGAGPGPRLELVRVLVRTLGRARPATVSDTLVTDDIDAFLATPADVVVEAIGGVAVPRRLAWEVLSTGRRYVTANRALIVDCGPELAEVATRCGAALDFSAAVGAWLPVARLLRDSAAGFGVEGLRGVFNGCANDLLGRLTTGISYHTALAEAQTGSAARVDPHDDINGRNSADQIAILAWLTFGCHPRALAVRRRGLGVDAADWSSIAAATGAVVKLVAEAAETIDGVVASVEPMLVPATSALGAAEGERSVVEVESRLAGTIVVQGQGMDSLSTASMLFADLWRGATSMPLPLPLPATPRLPTPPDPRELRWLMMLPRDGIPLLDDACRVDGIVWEDVFSATRPPARGIVALRCRPTALGVLVGRLEEAGLRPQWIRTTA